MCRNHSGNLNAVKWPLNICVAHYKVIRMQVYLNIGLKTFNILIISVSPEAVTHLRRRKLTGSVELLLGVLMMRPMYSWPVVWSLLFVPTGHHIRQNRREEGCWPKRRSVCPLPVHPGFSQTAASRSHVSEKVSSGLSDQQADGAALYPLCSLTLFLSSSLSGLSSRSETCR